MHQRITMFLLLAAACLSISGTGSAQERDRAKIADKYKWNLADLYPSDDAWKDAKANFSAALPKIETYKGTLNSGAGQLFGCLDLYASLLKDLNKISVYASLASDQDTRDSKYLGMNQEMNQVGADFSAKTAFLNPEILKMDGATIDKFFADEPRLKPYRQLITDIQRTKAHTGTEGEEKIMADAGLMGDAASSVYGIFSDADFPYPDVTLSDGKTVKLDKATFSRLRATSNRADREKVFAAFFGRLDEYRRTFGATMNANVKAHMFTMKARNYTSTLETSLDANNVPVAVYHSLVDNVNKNLSTFHRYLKLRARMLGVDQLHYYDLYAPLVSSTNLTYTVDEAQKHIISALKPLGSEYQGTIQKAFTDRWIDYYPTTGKRAGAYSQGAAYDIHPYMLINYNDQYTDMSTLAHELGHTMQSYYSNTNQPFILANYPIFVAEVASTFNEALLIDYMLKQIKDDDTRLSLLGNYLEGIKGTVFRQTSFAEMELKMHEMGEQGEALTGDKLDAAYFDIVKKYYGNDQGVCIVDEPVKAEWAFIPHFYYNYYVYQYATAYTASAALSENVLAGDKAATKKYLNFLAAGSSKYPIDLLKDAGVDMTTSQPLELVVKKMNRIMDEMERILDKKGKK